jgi:hypothetical protein
LQYLLTFLNFGKKVDIASTDLEASALRDWLEIEDNLKTDIPNPVIRNLRSVVEMFFGDWVSDVLLPKHGGGSVAEKGIRGVIDKNLAFQWHPRLKYLYGARPYMDVTGGIPVSPLGESTTQTQTALDVSRIKFVPKNWKKMRSICMEPISFQWAQQGVRLWYEAALRDSGLKDHIFLTDQRRNQHAAMFGSLTRQVDTIDLSAASDSVTWDLVSKIFPKKVLKHLYATRTHTVSLPNGALHKMQKYAPMGSALCFPVQSTVYAAIVVMCGIARRFGEDWRLPMDISPQRVVDCYELTFRKRLTEKRQADDHKFHPFFVYGDDIICDQQLTSNVVDALQLLGFKVNREKSYTGTAMFR